MGDVIVKAIRNTNDDKMKIVQFEQIIDKNISSISDLLSFANEGNPKFAKNKEKRVAFFNFSPDVIEKLGFEINKPVNQSLKPKLVVHEFCEGDIIPEEIQGYYKNNTHYVVPTWKTYVNGQLVIKSKECKKSPSTCENLLHNGKPIYRETHFAIADMCKDDVILTHDTQNVRV